MIEALSHGGKLMKSDTIEGVTVDQLAEALERGDGVCVELEPGDGTYYNLIILPTWAPEFRNKFRRFGINPGCDKDYLIVTRMNDDGGQTFIFQSWGEVWDLAEHIRNEWTVIFFTWWLKNLWRAILTRRGVI